MKILAIETSADETGIALVEATGEIDSPEFSILGSTLASQIKDHRKYGGIHPSLAKREHAKNLIPLLEQLESQLEDSSLLGSTGSPAGTTPQLTGAQKILERESELFEKLENFIETHEKPDIDMIAVTSGPGLEPALWVGINFARALSLIWDIPLLPVNHMEGHIASVLVNSDKKVTFPALALLISGGHTELDLVKNWGEYENIGETQDDAIGEAYDKVARMLDLPYPGGPEISKLAKEARENPRLRRDDSIVFPRPMIGTDNLHFSLSGLKTAVLYKVKDLTEEQKKLSEKTKKIIAKEFEQAVVDVLIKKTEKAISKTMAATLIVGGGVIANEYIRESLTTLAKKERVTIFFPKREHSTDNAVMIAVAGYLKSFREKPEIYPDIKAKGNLSL